MSNNISQELLKLKSFLEALSFPDLRKTAKENYGINVTRDHTKEDLLTLVLGTVSKNNYAKIADGDLLPGWARIKLPNTGDYRSNFPVHLNANGFECFIPFGVEVDVPIRCLEILDHAEEYRVDKNEFGERIHKFNISYPYQLIAKVDGPDPRPGIEVQREAKLRPKRRFVEQFGFFPTDKVFRDFIQSGMYKLDPEEFRVKPKAE